jgi:hypothetical protein
MSKGDDLSKSEAWETFVGLGATLAAVEPLTGAAMMLAGKVPGWWARRAGARATAWWEAFLEACGSEHLGLEEMRARIAEQMESNLETADVIMGHMRDVLDTVTSEAVAILGSLRGAYYGDGRKPDAFFRGATELLMQCTDADLEALRELTGRLACIRPRARSRTLAVNSFLDPNTGRRYQRFADMELDETPTTRQDILAAEWEVEPLWKRMQHLLVSTGLARDDNELYSFVVEHDDMVRLHRLVRQRGIREGTYRFYRGVRDGVHVAELASIRSCFGYGPTSDEALAALKSNLALFVEDATTAELVKIPRP